MDEFHLAHRLHLVRPVDAVHGPGLYKHGGTHVMAAVHVVGQLVEQISLERDPGGAVVPEMVVGVADT